ncbi:uncharacterized protein K452DRAFT_248519 [Aplosporella prunicola CBS 121167]|uniref:Transcription elongation factor 1 homolog n=1 Tax=Aplosporella prunicola CBS 121167 TaxID=1176127 RepID=A0A6A6BHJ1_9PEZI|nr:uncharacterized protein K452DRAFT_248519 [Aplosporella prunicola CBS 121167]KAF2142913.1 hypothetical protein K452DRAFT_248519 [Aplosporella prunicola CBS 121167]
MGKRKAAKKPQGPKKSDPLPTTFQCLFCNHENAVSVKMEKKIGIATLSCKVCSQSFQAKINPLLAPIDVYYEWLDACEEVAQNQQDSAGNYATDPYREPEELEKMRRRSAEPARGQRQGSFIDDDDAGDEGDYGDDD